MDAQEPKISVGARLRDNDPRMSGRELVVEKVAAPYVHCRHAKYASFPKTRVRIDRIHTDGKPRRSGFDLVQAN